ncbi:MAG: amidohydrolase family protein [Synechococcaceae cyanobacterium]|nr:amidohydrolase family protein [Synechococcaceae cyanobacterium]
MTVAASPLPPLRLPRSLLDPGLTHLPAADADGLVAVRLSHAEGRITAIDPAASVQAAAALPLALTPPVEPHAHLDKAFTAWDHPNREGTMEGAFAANLREAADRRAEQVYARGERALEQAWRYGLRAIRSHVDSLGPAHEPSWEALRELRRRWRGRIELQLVALVALDHWLTAEGEQLAARVGASHDLLGGVLGAPFSPARNDQRALQRALELAGRHGCSGVDLHIDESDRDHGRGMEMVASLPRSSQPFPPLTCSHASSMGLLPARRCQRLAERLAEREVRVVALPTTNLWLLGRQAGSTPWLRPQAPLRQLQAAGVEVAIGGDNVQDPWYPGGDFDPVALLRFSMAASHVMPWLRQGLSPFCSGAARLLGLEWDGVLRVGCPADLLILGAADWPSLLARPPQRRVLRQGCWLPAPQAEAPSPLLAGLAG